MPHTNTSSHILSEMENKNRNGNAGAVLQKRGRSHAKEPHGHSAFRA
jgi:hypothetical protein